ncbi:sperm-tail PG-rich repeat-containing protein 2-like [Gigantopelta aegis]|uniref:sperm-tail PG-rich repeat-containing protein 2-like n=1 Tax=Gigantopelta aegis TaxID=1735272 RepID=UPI001B88C177|nr:sperm-tail PG-rich repeat-containing protein 2-like [Gigantopelta aegis]
MYDRAERNLVVTYGSTPSNVGPGSYDAVIQRRYNIKADGYAPFMSMSSRETFLNITDQVVAAPGPGHYDPQAPQLDVKGGRTMANKSKRFQQNVEDIPGPGTYMVERNSDFSRACRSAPDGQGRGMLLTSRIKFHRKPEAPSIPCPGQSFGYEEREDGTLKKQEPPSRDQSLGPAFYKPSFDDTKCCNTYKGIHFGKLTSCRMNFAGIPGPGPGEYEPYREPLGKAENANVHEDDGSKHDTKLPRYHEIIVKQSEKMAIPGPGKYEIKGQFDPCQPKLNTEGIEVEHPPFMSQAKRFQPLKTGNPAPGSYNDPRNALESLNRVTGLKKSPFGQTSVRFQQQSTLKKQPGPGSYNISGLGAESMRKAYLESTRRGVFGTTSSRIQGLTKKDEADKPGPAHYQIKEKLHPSCHDGLTSNFASVTYRLAEPPGIVREIPPPGAYDVSQSYEDSQIKSKCRFAKPRTDAAKRKQGSFLSAASRFAPPRDMLIEQPDAETPGPGAYDHPSSELDPKKGLMVTKDKRFKELKSEGPGPGTYEFSPLIQDTVLKGTFNATLNNPLAQQLDPVHHLQSAKHAFLLGV